jgi:hypothetical protein
VVHSLVKWLDKLATGTENLQLIVFGGAHHDPGVVLVPVKIANAVGEASMHEKSKHVLVDCSVNGDGLAYSSGGPSSASSSVCSSPILLRSHMQIRRS